MRRNRQIHLDAVFKMTITDRSWAVFLLCFSFVTFSMPACMWFSSKACIGAAVALWLLNTHHTMVKNAPMWPTRTNNGNIFMYPFYLNPFKPKRFFHRYHLNESLLPFRGVMLIYLNYFDIK